MDRIKSSNVGWPLLKEMALGLVAAMDFKSLEAYP